MAARRRVRRRVKVRGPRLIWVMMLVVLEACGFPVLPKLGGADAGAQDASFDSAPVVPPKDITSFAFLKADNPGLTGDVIATINGTTIVAPIPPATNVTALVATFQTTGASVTVHGMVQTSGTSVNDFTLPVTYTVTASDNSTKQYKVSATYPSFTADAELGTGTGTSPRALAIADFNGDGKPDLAVADQTNNVSVFLNATPTNATTPVFGSRFDFATSTNSFGVAAGDFNGDGKPDLAVVAQSANRVSVLLNTTPNGALTPTFSAKSDFVTGATPFGIAVDDIDRDGKLDVVVPNSADSPGTVSVLINTTAPNATTATFANKVDLTVGTLPVAVASGDLNGDMKPDLAVVNQNSPVSSGVSVLFNTTTAIGSPTFSAAAGFGTGTTPVSVAIADVNRDGKLDLAVANDTTGSVTVLLNTTTVASVPAFAMSDVAGVGPNPLAVAFADINADGTPDLIVALLTSPTTITVLLNTTGVAATTPTFASRIDFTVGMNPIALAAADLNGDTKPDLAVANSGGAAASVLLNLTPAP